MAAVVVVLDRSLSMPMNGLFWAARSRAVEAIEVLERSESDDHLQAVVEFGTRASVVEPSQVQDADWDYDYGSNLADALRLSLSSLDGQRGRILLCSDLFASAHTDEGGVVVFQCPPASETLDRTVATIRSCGGAAVTIDAVRYRSGEAREEEEWPVAVVLDAILANGGTVEDVYIEDAVQGLQPTWRYSA